MEKSFGSTINQFADLRELIHEFYTRDPQLLVNWSRMEVVREKSVCNVELPDWANSPEDFCGVMRSALDSDVVSESLHLWIDLVFGCKQNCVESDNSFNPDCYEVDWSTCKSELSKRAMVVILKEYGVVPNRVLVEECSAKKFRICVVSESGTEVKGKMQKMQNQIQHFNQIHNKEFKAQEKQYKQMLSQEMNEKNQEIHELKHELFMLKNQFNALTQQHEETVKQKNELGNAITEKRFKGK